MGTKYTVDNSGNLTAAGDINTATTYKVNGTPLSSTDLSDGPFLTGSQLNAKGDLLTATAPNTPAILAVGTNGYVLTADSAQATGLIWSAASGSGTPASPFTSIQFNDSGAFGGSANLVWDNTNFRLGLSTIPVNTLDVSGITSTSRLIVAGTSINNVAKFRVDGDSLFTGGSVGIGNQFTTSYPGSAIQAPLEIVGNVNAWGTRTIARLDPGADVAGDLSFGRGLTAGSAPYWSVSFRPVSENHNLNIRRRDTGSGDWSDVLVYDQSNGNVGVNTTPSGARLHVAGTIKVVDGSQAAGKVLTSDSTGLASWVTPIAGSIAGSDTYVQYNASTNLGANINFKWDYSANSGSGRLLLGNPTSTSGYLEVNSATSTIATLMAESFTAATLTFGNHNTANNCATMRWDNSDVSISTYIAGEAIGSGWSLRRSGSGDTRLGIATSSPGERLDVVGGIKLGSAVNTNNGTIQWTGSDFQGRVGGLWVSLTAGTAGQTLWHVLPNTLATNQTAYLLFNDTAQSTEGDAQMVAPTTMTVKNLTVKPRGATNFNSNTVFTVRKNAVDTSLTVTLGSSVSTMQQDTSDIVSLVAGDILSLKVLVGSLATIGVTVDVALTLV